MNKSKTYNDLMELATDLGRLQDLYRKVRMKVAVMEREGHSFDPELTEQLERASHDTRTMSMWFDGLVMAEEAKQ